ELNSRANQLARYLRLQGVQAGDYIPIVMSRCPQLLIAQLAVLKCGGAYVPVDPTQPIERQEFIIRDCVARWVLVEPAVGAAGNRESIQWIDPEAVAGP